MHSPRFRSLVLTSTSKGSASRKTCLYGLARPQVAHMGSRPAGSRRTARARSRPEPARSAALGTSRTGRTTQSTCSTATAPIDSTASRCSSSSDQAAPDGGAKPALTSIKALKTHIEAKLPTIAAKFSGPAPTSADAIYPILDQYLTDNPDFYGCTLEIDPSRVAGGLAPYSYRTAGGLGHKDLAQVPEYNFSKQEWYAKPKASGTALWSAPYFDTGGGEINMITYSRPVTSEDTFLGILTTDVGIDGRPEK